MTPAPDLENIVVRLLGFSRVSWICEAVTRATMRFVEIKTSEQQGTLVLHRVRLMLTRQRTQLSNAIRGHMAEYGLVAPVGRNGLQRLIAILGNPESVAAPAYPAKVWPNHLLQLINGAGPAWQIVIGTLGAAAALADQMNHWVAPTVGYASRLLAGGALKLLLWPDCANFFM